MAFLNRWTVNVYFVFYQMALSGWVCVVTGASRGIGKGIALQLSEAGATVYITGRNEKTLKEAAVEVRTPSPQGSGVLANNSCCFGEQLYEEVRRYPHH